MVEEKPGFEEKVKKLEEILAELESGELPLEEAIARYRRGIEILRSCYEELDEFEGKLVKLVRLEDGKVGEVPFDAGEDEDGF